MNFIDKYIKYKTLYLKLKNIQIGGNKQILEKKLKMIEFVKNKIYALNNIDVDKLDEESEFPIGSITKLFTIISLLILHQNKQININDNIGKYINNNEIKELKIIDIMNHKSGLKEIFDGVDYGKSKIKYTSATEVYNKWNNGKLIDKNLIGKFAYSNMGFIILGYLIETITNIKYSDFVKKNILIPLKMKNTGIKDCNVILYKGLFIVSFYDLCLLLFFIN